MAKPPLVKVAVQLAAAALMAAGLAYCATAQPGAGRAGQSGLAGQPRQSGLAQARQVTCPGGTSRAARKAAALPRRTVPAGFTPVAAVECSPEIVFTTSGRPPIRPVKQVAVSGLARLVAALRSRPVPTGPNVICAAQAVIMPWFVLVSGNGQVILPRVPAGQCGEPSSRLLASLAALRWVTVRA